MFEELQKKHKIILSSIPAFLLILSPKSAPIFIGLFILFINNIDVRFFVSVASAIIILVPDFLYKDSLDSFSSISLLLPIFTWLTLGYKNAGIFFITTGISLFFVKHDAAVVGYYISLLAFLSFFFKKFVEFAKVILILASLTTPLFSFLTFEKIDYIHKFYLKDASHAHRLYIWKVISDFVFEKPILGHGFKATSKIENRLKQFSAIELINQHGKRYKIGTKGKDFAVHPHNFFLQIWFEFGFVGILLFIFLCTKILNKINRLNKQYKVIFLGSLSYYLFFSGTSINIWSGLNIMTFLFIIRILSLYSLDATYCRQSSK